MQQLIGFSKKNLYNCINLQQAIYKDVWFSRIYIPFLHVSAFCGSADLSSQEAKAIHTKHMSDCLRNKRQPIFPAGKGPSFQAIVVALKAD